MVNVLRSIYSMVRPNLTKNSQINFIFWVLKRMNIFLSENCIDHGISWKMLNHNNMQGAPNQWWAGKVFSRGGAGHGLKSRGGVGRGGVGKGSKSLGRRTYCVYWVIEIICYSRGNLNLHCIKLKWNILDINSHHFYDYNHSSVLS